MISQPCVPSLNSTPPLTTPLPSCGPRAARFLRRGYDIVGVVVIAMVSALGGGLIRDAVFLNQQPVLIRQPTYLLLVAIAVVPVASRYVTTAGRPVGMAEIAKATPVKNRSSRDCPRDTPI